MNPVILFVFAGRKANLELQLPFVRKILDQNKNVEFHVWNLARDNTDAKYLQTIEGERITLFNEYRHSSPGYDKVYRHYADDQFRHHAFVKVDDDVVFIQTSRFAQFVRAVKAHPDSVLSANIINNGACTAIEPGLWEKFERTGLPLLDVHKSAPFAALAHNYFFDHHAELLARPIELIPTSDWLSINMMGYTWEVGLEFARLTGTKCAPRNVAGRDLHWLGDEGVANTLPRIIMRGMLACHLSFGPQNLTAQLLPWRSRYAGIGEEYLSSATRSALTELPALSGVSGRQQEPVHQIRNWANPTIDPTSTNDPQVGRFTP